MDRLSNLLFNKEPKQVDCGIEIELEGNSQDLFLNPLSQNFDKSWRLENDGSLRNGVELVLRRPCRIKSLPMHLNRVTEEFLRHNITNFSSDRTGVHLHINVGDLTPIELVKFLCCYYIVEEALIDTLGENRIGNHFCLRAVDAEFVIHQIHYSLAGNNIFSLNDDSIRYTAGNIRSIFNHGSFEFRAMQTTPHFYKDILQILNFLLTLKNNSKEFSTPEDILMSFSGDGCRAMVSRLLGKWFSRIEKVSNLEEKLIKGARLTQELVYANPNLNNHKSKSFNWGLKG